MVATNEVVITLCFTYYFVLRSDSLSKTCKWKNGSQWEEEKLKGKKKKNRGDYKEEEEVSDQYKVKAKDDEREPDRKKSLVRVVVC